MICQLINCIKIFLIVLLFIIHPTKPIQKLLIPFACSPPRVYCLPIITFLFAVFINCWIRKNIDDLIIYGMHFWTLFVLRIFLHNFWKSLFWCQNVCFKGSQISSDGFEGLKNLASGGEVFIFIMLKKFGF